MNPSIKQTFGSCIALTALTFASIPAYGQNNFKDIFHNLADIQREAMRCLQQTSESSTADELIQDTGEIAEASAAVEVTAGDGVAKLLKFFIKKGFQKLENKNYAGALCYFNQVIEKDVSSKYVSTAYLGRGLTYIEQGDKQKGIADLKEASRLFKSQGDKKNFQKVTRIIQQFTNNGSVTAYAQSTEASITGTYGECLLLGHLTPTPSGLGQFTLDGKGNYSSTMFGKGHYVFNPEENTVHFIDGKMKDLLGIYSVDKKGRSAVRFYIDKEGNFYRESNSNVTTGMTCPNQNN